MGVKPGQKPLTKGQREALARMPEIKDSEFPKVYDNLPASTYVDVAQFEKEKTAVFGKKPTVIGLSAAIPEPNMYFQRYFLGTPVLITRNKDGEVKAFVNVCSHRGSKLCSNDEAARGGRIVCPYHAWTYSLDGKLVGLPRQEIFPGVDKAELGLQPLPCVEAGGLIWVGISPAEEPDFSDVRGELADDLDALGLADMRLFRSTCFSVKANWKLVMDTMNDSYHVTRLHKDSLAKYFVDAQNIIDPIGPHLRVAAHRGNFDKSVKCENFEQASKIMLFAYTLFPNCVVVPSPGFISIGIIEPVDAANSRVHYFMLAYDSLDDEKLNKAFDLMVRVFGNEDYRAAELCQEGLSAGTLDKVHFGGMEVQIPFFHNEVKKCLEEQ